MRRLLQMWLILLLLVFSLTPAHAEAGRVDVSTTCGVRPWRLLNKQFSGNANVFTIVTPVSALTESSATGCTHGTGAVSVLLQSGFTPTITLTLFVWLNDPVTPANSNWAAFSTASVTANNSMVVLACPHNMPFIIQSSAAVTGNVYVDAPADKLNANSPTSYYQPPQG
jgi:hypothetical protein